MYGINIPRYLKQLRYNLREYLANSTGINVKEINIEVYTLFLENES